MPSEAARLVALRTGPPLPTPLPPDPPRHPPVPHRRGEGEDRQRREAWPERGGAADLEDEAAGAEGWEGEAAQHVEGMAEEEEPDAGERPGGVQPEEEGREGEGDEGEVALEAEHVAGERGARHLFPGAGDRGDFDRAACED